MIASPGGRTVSVPPQRLERWLDGFAERHGSPEVRVTCDQVTLRSPDGAIAQIPLSWGPLPGEHEPLQELLTSFTTERTVGALIVRRRGHAVGIFAGPTLLTGRHHRHYVQGKTKAGGWSQQRYARRRANQAGLAYESAIADAAQVLVPRAGMVALATGGDQGGLDIVLADKRLGALLDLPRLRVAGVPDPNAGVLAGFGALFCQVRIDVNEFA
jgi:hypothetical protein